MFSQNVPHIRQTLSPQSFIIIARPKYFTSNASYDLWHRKAWQQVDTNSRWMQNMKDRWKVRGIPRCSPPCQWTQMRLTPAAWEGNLSDISCLCICCDKYISPKQGDVAAMEVKEKTMELLCRLLVHVEGWTGVAVGKVGILWSLGLSAQEEAWTWVMFGTNYELCWFFFFFAEIWVLVFTNEYPTTLSKFNIDVIQAWKFSTLVKPTTRMRIDPPWFPCGILFRRNLDMSTFFQNFFFRELTQSLKFLEDLQELWKQGSRPSHRGETCTWCCQRYLWASHPSSAFWPPLQCIALWTTSEAVNFKSL